MTEMIAPLGYQPFAGRMQLHPETARLVASARAMKDTLRARAAEAERNRVLQPETIDELRSAGFFRLMQPVAYGGCGREFADYIVVAEELGAACPSSSWIFANIVLKSWMVPMFPVAAQHEIWGDSRDTIVSSILRPTGKSRPVAGGYRLSGTWSYVSGVDHTQWTIIGSIAEPSRAGERPQPVVHLVPRRDYALEDNWH